MAFVADEKLNAVVQPLPIISAFTTLRNNYWVVFNVIVQAGHDITFLGLRLSSRSDPLLIMNYGEDLQIGPGEDVLFVQVVNRFCRAMVKKIFLLTLLRYVHVKLEGTEEVHLH